MGKYDKIINHPHHQSATRPHMTLHDRAAQFAPFAALTGYEACVAEAARTTNERIELSDTETYALNRAIQFLTEHLMDAPSIAITFFIPDKKKAGGKYITEEGIVKKIDKYNGIIVLENGQNIPIVDVLKIESEAFPPDW